MRTLAYQKSLKKTSDPDKIIRVTPDICVDEFVVRVSCRYGGLELSWLPPCSIGIYEVICQRDISFPALSLDRLRVQERARGNGIANTLLMRAMQIADEHHASVVLQACPYSADISLYRLVRLYNRFNFLIVCQQRSSALMLRSSHV